MKNKSKNKVEVVFHKNTKENVILLDMNNTFYNIRLLIKNQYPNTPIEIVNEGMGER